MFLKIHFIHIPDSTIMSSSAIQVSPSLELISASLDSSGCIFPMPCMVGVEAPCTASSSLIGRTSECPWRASESVSLWAAELLSFFGFGCFEFLLRLMRALFSPSLLPLSAAVMVEPSDNFFSFLSFLRSDFELAWLSYRESLRRILSSRVLSECMRRMFLPLFARALRTNVWMVCMSELPSPQVLPMELLLPPPPPSADSPELWAELDDVGDHEFSCRTARKIMFTQTCNDSYFLLQAFVCYLAGLWKNYCTNYHETWWKDVAWIGEELIKFRCRSRDCFSLC